MIAGKHNGDKVELISDMNQFHQTLVQAGDCEPAKGGKKDPDMSTLLGMMARLEGKMSQLQSNGRSGGNGSGSGSSGSSGGGNKHKCHNCGSEDHIKKDCPQLHQGQGSSQ